MTFSKLGLQEELLLALKNADYTTPTPVQLEAIPAILAGRDVLASAQTGTGKTAGFVLPILQILTQRIYDRNRPLRALILTPTRELAAQVGESVLNYGANLQPRLKSAVVFGGVKINPQMLRLRGGVDILTATPGRLLDLVSQNAIRLNKVEILVLDEADRMLDMGFGDEIGAIMALLPKKRQNLLFSATFPAEIRQLTDNLLLNPLNIAVAEENAPAETIEQAVYLVNKTAKTALLIHLCKTRNWQQALVFISSKRDADKLVVKLNNAHIKAAALHGDKSQAARTSVLAAFKQGDIQVLVATDLAARGIDIIHLPQVVNYDLPRSASDYLHRIGRTGRAGQSGMAISLIAEEDYPALRLVEKLIGQKLPREEIKGFLAK